MFSSLFSRFRPSPGEYPNQFWLLFWGLLISSTGGSMIWPFLMIYVSGRLNLPLSTVAILMTVNAVVGLVFSFVAGPVTDRVGRKWIMIISLMGNAIGYLLMSQADSMPAFALLMALSGAVNPLYRVGADAMLADIVPPEKRIDAYSWLRMSNNVGVAMGPAIGGFIAATSYRFAFYLAAAGFGIYSLLLLARAHETLPARLTPEGMPQTVKERFGGYERILADRPFVFFVGAFILVQMCAALIWILMSVYAKDHYGVVESQYGLIPTTNAIMVVFLQIYVTRYTKRHSPLRVLALGSLFYAVGTGLVAFGQGFWGFWLAMVVMTFGELILVPTSNTYAANAAPPAMRGRYMSIYGLTWGAAMGIAPVIGGYLNDYVGPRFTWYGGFLVGLLAASSFLLLARVYPHPPRSVIAPSSG